MEKLGGLRVQTYGEVGPWVVVLHGGPGAPGSAAGLAQGLSDGFRVIEPWQRGSGAEPLSVATHIRDLDAVIRERCAAEPVALVGHSWGAMLALAYGAAHPRANTVALVGCGTFDHAARTELQAKLKQRNATGASAYDFAPIELAPDETYPLFDQAAFDETWDDMLRLQATGVYPSAFSGITCPALMIHGDYDPHPGPTIRDGLQALLPLLRYVELEHCGHTPWNERFAREEFFDTLRGWLVQTLR